MLRAEDFAVDEDIRRAEGLPVRAFADPAFLARELETIFARAWLLVPPRPAHELRDDPRPLEELVSVRGARVPFSLLGRPLFLQRGWDDDELRCFDNACTHAWFPLVSGPARGHTIVCGQHGRKFDCAGRFLSQPGFQGGEVEGFPRDCDHLSPHAVVSWREHLFTCLGAPAAPFAETFAEVDASLACFPPVRRVAQPVETREVAGNWKQHAWNFMDKFHIGFIHRAPGGLADAIDVTSYRTELHRHAALQWVWAKDPAAGIDPAHLPRRFEDPKGEGGRRVFALWWFVWPNLTLNYYAWGLSLNCYLPVRGRPDVTQFLWVHFVLDEEKYARRDTDWLAAQIDAEDVDALAQVGRVIRGGAPPRGRFAPKEEAGPHWFHRKVYEEVFSPGSSRA
jgi:choline monooxygenase